VQNEHLYHFANSEAGETPNLLAPHVRDEMHFKVKNLIRFMRMSLCYGKC